MGPRRCRSPPSQLIVAIVVVGVSAVVSSDRIGFRCEPDMALVRVVLAARSRERRRRSPGRTIFRPRVDDDPRYGPIIVVYDRRLTAMSVLVVAVLEREPRQLLRDHSTIVLSSVLDAWGSDRHSSRTKQPLSFLRVSVEGVSECLPVNRRK